MERPKRPRIVFGRHVPGLGEQLLSMNADGTDVNQLTGAEGQGESCCPSCSPDGKRIAYSQFAGIWVLPVDGSGAAAGEPARLTSNSRAEHDHPAWSPDGCHIAFDSETPGDPEPIRRILTMRGDGSNLRDLGEGQLPTWSPPLRST